jgi:hypothetical protein
MAKKATSKRKSRGRKAASAAPEISINGIGDLNGNAPSVDPETGALTVGNEDGSVTIDFSNPYNSEADDIDTSDHDANLALKLSDWVLHTVAEELLEGIESDDRSRSDFINMRAKGIDLLGVKLEDPKSGVGSSSAPLEGMSVVRDPLMLEAVLRFQANAQGEMLPASGPVKVVDYGTEDIQSDKLSEKLEKDLNFYLTTTASEYYPDTRRMFFWTGFGGMAFKKVYKCPLRRRPVSESVDATDLIVSDMITDLRNAGRITHQITMRQSTMKRMQILGVYRDVELERDPQPKQNAVQDKIDRVQGIQSRKQDRPQDSPYQIYECYCELDIPGFEHKDDKGKETGLPLPYRVTIETTSREILEIRRNWKEDDSDYLAKIPFVAFPYATGLGFYGIGLLHILGNLTNALTALTREAIDAGMFANFPGFLISKSAQRQQTNEFRIPPGGGLPVETGDKPISQMVMPLPYHEAGPSHMTLIQMLSDKGQRVGGTADTPVGEGKQDAPVGTTLALIEQATKIEGAVHKSLHAAQAEEFRLLCDLFRDDPESLWRGNKRPALADVQMFQAALDRCDIVPKADPNVPSHMHRVMKAQAVVQMAALAPGEFNAANVAKWALGMMDIDDTDELLAAPQQPQGPPPVDPMAQAKMAIDHMNATTKQAQVALDAQNKAKDRESKQNIEVMKLAATAGVHGPQSNDIINQQVAQLAPLMTNIKQVPAVSGPTPPGQPPAGPPPPPAQMPPPQAQPRPPMPIPIGLGGLGRPMNFAPPPPARFPPMAQGIR